ncbi:hypothetical protein [Streptomyces sp. CBMA152]|uniref:hypothetical protein n=1 Tax=Streptomyces sp. CBMA152 TaxID=1896312 RepID=UPI0016603982|nr:hypothetical protein [Streptomyces sp. CBMA152]
MRRKIVVLFFVCVSGVAALLGVSGCGQDGTEGAAPPASVDASGTPSHQGARQCPTTDDALKRPSAPPTVIDGVGDNTPAATRISQAVGDQGYGAYGDVYGTQANDFPVGRVALCVTDLARGRDLVKAAAKADPGADPKLVDLYMSRYAHRTLQKAVDKVFGRKFAFPLYSASATSDASGIRVTTNAAGAGSASFRRTLEKATGGIPVVVERGAPAVADVGRSPSP